MQLKKVWLSLRRKHPQLIYKLANGDEIGVALGGLHSANPLDVAAAREICNTKNRQIALGLIDAKTEFGSGSTVPLWQFADDYLNARHAAAAAGDLSPATVNEDRKTFKRLLQLMPPDVPLSNIDDAFVNTFISRLRTVQTSRGKLTHQTINKFLRHLQTAFNDALKRNYIMRNPFADVARLKVARPESYIRVLTAGERAAFESYFASCKYARWRLPAFRFALFTLCRGGSIVRVKYSDIYTDIVDGETLQFIRLNEKRNTSRAVPLFPEALAAIDDMRRLAAYPQKLFKHTHKNHNWQQFYERINAGYIFFPIARLDTVSRMMTDASARLLRAGKIRAKAKFHDLRDTGATLLLDRRVSIETVSYMLGHSNIVTTQRHYARLTPQKAARDTRHLRSG